MNEYDVTITVRIRVPAPDENLAEAAAMGCYWLNISASPNKRISKPAISHVALVRPETPS